MTFFWFVLIAESTINLMKCKNTYHNFEQNNHDYKIDHCATFIAENCIKVTRHLVDWNIPRLTRSVVVCVCVCVPVHERGERLRGQGLRVRASDHAPAGGVTWPGARCAAGVTWPRARCALLPAAGVAAVQGPAQCVQRPAHQRAKHTQGLACRLTLTLVYCLDMIYI